MVCYKFISIREKTICTNKEERNSEAFLKK